MLRHPSHRHPLYLANRNTAYTCDGCSIGGSGERYRCNFCDFDLHEYCATCPSRLQSYIHKHMLTLINIEGACNVCDLCGDNVSGLFYTCRSCDFDVHPLCTQLPKSVQHPDHPHHSLTLQPGMNDSCKVCDEECESWRYRCNVCDVDVHLECVYEPFQEPYEPMSPAKPILVMPAPFPNGNRFPTLMVSGQPGEAQRQLVSRRK